MQLAGIWNTQLYSNARKIKVGFRLNHRKCSLHFYKDLVLGLTSIEILHVISHNYEMYEMQRMRIFKHIY